MSKLLNRGDVLLLKSKCGLLSEMYDCFSVQVHRGASGGVAGLHRRAESVRQRRAPSGSQRLQRHVLHTETLCAAVARPRGFHQPRSVRVHVITYKTEL